MLITDAKLVGTLRLYKHNGDIGACDRPYATSPKSYIDTNVPGGEGMYLIIVVVDDVIREIGIYCLNGSNLFRETVPPSQNGWLVTGKRIINETKGIKINLSLKKAAFYIGFRSFYIRLFKRDMMRLQIVYKHKLSKHSAVTFIIIYQSFIDTTHECFYIVNHFQS